jgi:acetyltransferase-like isoleucine patch superfamily enzyme
MHTTPTKHRGILSDFSDFVRRMGIRTTIGYLVELYIGWVIRGLPGPEGFLLRGWLYRLLMKHVASHPLIYPNCHIIFSHGISLGKRVAINVGSYLDGRGGIEIGDGSMIGPNCILSSCEHGFTSIEIPMYKQPVTLKKIVIQEDVWIGGNVCIKSGVTIGKGSIVGAGSVVTKDIPPYTIVAGVPAKPIRDRRTGEAFPRQ